MSVVLQKISSSLEPVEIVKGETLVSVPLDLPLKFGVIELSGISKIHDVLGLRGVGEVRVTWQQHAEVCPSRHLLPWCPVASNASTKGSYSWHLLSMELINSTMDWNCPNFI